MKHARVSEKPGRVHGVPPALGNNHSALCGHLPTGHVSGEEIHGGSWRSTREPIDCQNCIHRLETFADALAEQAERHSLRAAWADEKIRYGVCSSCGRTRRIKNDGTLGSHREVSNTVTCPGVDKPPSYIAVPVLKGEDLGRGIYEGLAVGLS
jgi:hypothetical protein